MAELAVTQWTEAERRYADAMRAEVDWAPLHFEGWSHYEQARPLLTDETIEVIGRWPEHCYTLQYRPMLGELTQARQFPIDRFPEITVLGRVDENDLPELRSIAAHGFVDELPEAALRVAKSNRTIPIEPPLRTGSTIPDHEEVPVHYMPTTGRWLEEGRLIHEDHSSAAYAVAGHWGIRLGPPVGLTPTGLLVFQPAGMRGLRISVEHPTSQPVGSRVTEARVGLYRHDGLGGWEQTATIGQADELQLLARSAVPVQSFEAPLQPTRWRHA